MRNIFFYVVCLAGGCLGQAVVQAETSYPYQLIELGTLGGRNCEALALNNCGQIVGWAEIPNGQHHAALWDINDPLHPVDLGTLGGNSSIAVAINNRGQSVGQARTSEAGYHYHATRFDWSLSQANLDLGNTTGYAYAINDAGQIVGNVQLNNGHWRAVLFDAAAPGQPIDLGTLPPTWGPDDSGATAIDNEGRIVGWAYSGVGSSNFMRPVVFDPSGQGQNTRLTLGTDGGMAQGINDFGQIVGSSNEAGGACIFDANTQTAQGLGTLPDGVSSEAAAINNRGQIVGMVYRVFTPGLDPLPRAVLFEAAGQGNNLDLNDAIDPNLQWRLNSAQGINDQGWIVGYGDTSENERRGFVLLPRSHPYQTLAHWTFDESQGHWLHDHMPGEHHGYAPAPPHWQPSAGRLDGGCLCAADNGFTVVDESFFDVTDQLTISGWITFKQAHANHPTIISKGDSAWSLSLSPEAAQIVFSLSTGQQSHRFTSTVSLEEDLYYHICATYDGHSMRLYIDGHEDPTGPLACTGPIDTNNEPVQIGGWNHDPNHTWQGALDDLRLYNYALTPHEIRKRFQAAPLYVDAAATGQGTGTSWQDAFDNLEDALDAVSAGQAIHLAAGTYCPNNASTPFAIPAGVTLKGGFSGTLSPPGVTRDTETYPTRLSGDVLQNDRDPHAVDPYTDNCVHVVVLTAQGTPCRLDGLIISSGRAHGQTYADRYGGGILAQGAEAILIDCRFDDNQAERGGALFTQDSHLWLEDCALSFNDADTLGGAICSYSPLQLRNCTFTHNRATLYGGAFWGRAAQIKECSFSNNVAAQGGGLFFNGDTALDSCWIHHNTADQGAGVFAQDCDTTLWNCTLENNIATDLTGGLRCDEGDVTLETCLLQGNQDRSGTNQAAQLWTAQPATINHCCIQGWDGTLDGEGNRGLTDCHNW